jgi:hypothetical protein
MKHFYVSNLYNRNVPWWLQHNCVFNCFSAASIFRFHQDKNAIAIQTVRCLDSSRNGLFPLLICHQIIILARGVRGTAASSSACEGPVDLLSSDSYTLMMPEGGGGCGSWLVKAPPSPTHGRGKIFQLQ